MKPDHNEKWDNEHFFPGQKAVMMVIWSLGGLCSYLFPLPHWGLQWLPQASSALYTALETLLTMSWNKNGSPYFLVRLSLCPVEAANDHAELRDPSKVCGGDGPWYCMWTALYFTTCSISLNIHTTHVYNIFVLQMCIHSEILCMFIP